MNDGNDGDNDEIMGFGKYSNLTFHQVVELHPDYCRWALGVDHPRGHLAEFVEYLLAHYGEEYFNADFHGYYNHHYGQDWW